MKLVRLDGRKPHSIKKNIRKTIEFFINDQWKGLFFYLITEFVNHFFKIFFRKNSKQKICPICNHVTKNFHHLSNHYSITWNSACQKCDSRSRHRRLFFLYLKYINYNKKQEMLHFAPEKILNPKFLNSKKINYFTTDFKMKDLDYPKEDIQNLSFDDLTFDIFLCNDVLEHVKDDRKSLKEISRILNNNGFAFINIPGNWNSSKTIYYKHLNYNGHYRDYGLDIIPLMKLFFSKVKKINLFRLGNEVNGIHKLETAFIFQK